MKNNKKIRLLIFVIACIVLCQSCKNSKPEAAGSETHYEITFTVTLMPEDSAATRRDLEEFVAYYLEINKLPGANYFFEYGMQELNPRKITIKKIGK